MSKNLLDQLAEIPIPPPPMDIPRQVHRRLNGWLLAGQLADLAVRGMPYAMFQFMRAVLAGLTFSLTGKLPVDPQDSSDSQ